MRRRALQLIAISCLVALAGCSGALSGGAGTTTGATTTAGGGATTTASGLTLQDVSYPAGVTDNGTNVSTLADAHAAALENRSLTLTLDSTVNASTTNQSVRVNAAVSGDRDTALLTAASADRAMSVYLTGEKRYTRVGRGENATYRVTDRQPDSVKLVSSSYSGATYLHRYGSVGNFTPTGVRTVNGTTLVALHADGSNATTMQGVNVTDYDATMLVDQQGLVHSMSVEATSEQDGQRLHLAFTMNVSNVGSTTVEQPTWLDAARNSTSN